MTRNVPYFAARGFARWIFGDLGIRVCDFLHAFDAGHNPVTPLHVRLGLPPFADLDPCVVAFKFGLHWQNTLTGPGRRFLLLCRPFPLPLSFFFRLYSPLSPSAPPLLSWLRRWVLWPARSFLLWLRRLLLRLLPSLLSLWLCLWLRLTPPPTSNRQYTDTSNWDERNMC